MPHRQADGPCQSERMISDSVPWREQLLASADALERRGRLTGWDERTSFTVERDVLIGAFTMRKLTESGKSSTLLPDERVAVLTHPLTGRVPRPLDRWLFWEFYDVTSTQHATLTVRRLWNAFIHSFVLEFSPPNEDEPARVWVISERDRHHRLYSLPLSTVVDLFRRVGDENVGVTRLLADGPPVRISQHDLVDAGLAAYDPYPDIDRLQGGTDVLAAAFPQLEDAPTGWPRRKHGHRTSP